MSNKTKLQANNTQLATLIQTLQGKAAGGGGGNVKVFVADATIAPVTVTMEGMKFELVRVGDVDDLSVEETPNVEDFVVLQVASGEYTGKLAWDIIAVQSRAAEQAGTSLSIQYMENNSMGIFYESYGFTMFMFRLTNEAVANYGLDIQTGLYLNVSSSILGVIYTGH